MSAPTHEQDEQEQAQRMKDGDRAAMKTVYCQHVRYLTAICARYIPSEEDVKDVMQDAFLKIFSSAGSFEYRGKGSLRGWMARIVLDATLKFIHPSGRPVFVPLPEDITDIADELPDLNGVPLPTIHQMIRELPQGYRTIFNLYVFEEKSHKEIASMLGIKESTSASQLHRAKAILAKKVNAYKKQMNRI